MPDRPEIVGRLETVFQDTFDDPALRIHDAMTAADLDDWDSLQHIVLVLAVEREFGVKLNPAEVGKLENVGKMVDLLLEKTARV
ncbi:MAG: acyl carrier protein [Rhodospirillales bacterium]|nr:acyl carrier protein [Rhodospirillales bacterium]MBN8897294.1 acyl carrier protein [Rhodospirillales bacterium]